MRGGSGGSDRIEPQAVWEAIVTSEKTPLIAALERRDTLSEEERSAIASLPARMAEFANGAEIVAYGEHSRTSCLMLEGFSARVQFLRAGKRQISAVHVPGDFVDLHGFLLKVMDHSVVSVGRSRTAFVDHGDLERLTTRFPHLARLFWMLTVIDGAIQRAFITCLGRRSPKQHIAHLLCELYLRLDVVGLAQDGLISFPVTQEILGDILGLSTVHVNRTLQDLRATGLIQWRGATITIPDFDKLATFAEFDPLYLQLRREPR